MTAKSMTLPRFDERLGLIFTNGDSMPWPTNAPDEDWDARGAK